VIQSSTGIADHMFRHAELKAYTNIFFILNLQYCDFMIVNVVDFGILMF
jgi:hypothetical protein